MLKASIFTSFVIALVGAQVLAAATVLTFEGVGDQVEVGNFYDGAGGPDYNIQFAAGSLSIIDEDAGGGGNFANEPTPDTILFFLYSNSAIMNVLDGFDTGFSFFYTAAFNAGSVNVYDDFNAGGNLLASLNLAVNGTGCGGDPTGDFNCWTPVGVLFDGIAKSVDFGGVANQIGFDNITLGSDKPGGSSDVPEPATWLLVAAGLALVARRRGALRNS